MSALFLSYNYETGCYLIHSDKVVHDHHDMQSALYIVDTENPDHWETYDVSHWTIRDEDKWDYMTDGMRLGMMESMTPLPKRCFHVMITHYTPWTHEQIVTTVGNGSDAVEWAMRWVEHTECIDTTDWVDWSYCEYK